MNKDISIPKSLYRVPLKLQELYLDLISYCLDELPYTGNSPASDKARPSVMVPLSSKRKEIFVQFKPTKKNMNIELHIDLGKLNDSRKLCRRSGDKRQWSIFTVCEDGIDKDYYKNLIEQSYIEVSLKANLSSTNIMKQRTIPITIQISEIANHKKSLNVNYYLKTVKYEI